MSLLFKCFFFNTQAMLHKCTHSCRPFVSRCRFWLNNIESLRKETKCYRGRGGISSERRGTAIQRKTKSAHVTMSGFLLHEHMCQNTLFSMLSMKPTRLHYVTRWAMWSRANSVTRSHFLINSAANDLTGEQFRTTSSIWDKSILKAHIEIQQIHFFTLLFFFYCVTSLTLTVEFQVESNYCILTLFTFQHTNKQSIDQWKKSALV